jgi:hypothetical protein
MSQRIETAVAVELGIDDVVLAHRVLHRITPRRRCGYRGIADEHDLGHHLNEILGVRPLIEISYDGISRISTEVQARCLKLPGHIWLLEFSERQSEQPREFVVAGRYTQIELALLRDLHV